MRVRAGATAIVALIVVLPDRAIADDRAIDAATATDRSRCQTADCEAPAPPLYDTVATVATHTTRAQLSEFLVVAAERAAKARDWAHAIPLYQALVVARGPGSASARELATLWTLAGQNERAAEVWSRYAAAVSDPDERRSASAEAARLAGGSDPFADKLVLAEQTADARRAFALGRTAFRAGQFGDALVYFHMGYALAPELPGFLRELGATYDKLGAEPSKREFYRRYLVQRPIGPNADAVRAELTKDSGKDGTDGTDGTDNVALGTLQVTTSLPCTELWLNRQKLTTKLPDKGLVVAPGTYKGLCFNPRFEMALFEYVTVEPGKPSTMAFRWGIIENRLEHPLGRIALENPKAPGVMIDLGITSLEVGVAAPADGRKLKMILKDDAGIRTEVRSVQVEPGQRLVVKW